MTFNDESWGSNLIMRCYIHVYSIGARPFNISLHKVGVDQPLISAHYPHQSDLPQLHRTSIDSFINPEWCKVARCELMGLSTKRLQLTKVRPVPAEYMGKYSCVVSVDCNYTSPGVKEIETEKRKLTESNHSDAEEHLIHLGVWENLIKQPELHECYLTKTLEPDGVLSISLLFIAPNLRLDSLLSLGLIS